jgi:hypothetical protein
LVSVPVIFSGIEQALSLFVIAGIMQNLIVLLLEILSVRTVFYVIQRVCAFRLSALSSLQRKQLFGNRIWHNI